MARIRSVHPEFWRSEDVAALDWQTRLLFIGLWSYVDDNGVGRDVEKLICAELFPLEEDPRETLATVSRGLQALCEGGQIERYTVDGKPFFYITAWGKWQRIDRPGKERYPLPTCENAEPRESVASVPRIPRESPATGEGEKGRRGEVKNLRSTDVEREFDEWYQLYPKKAGRQAAIKAWVKARRIADSETITAGLKAHLPGYEKKERQFIPDPATWLNQGRWEDEVADPAESERQSQASGGSLESSLWAQAREKARQQARS